MKKIVFLSRSVRWGDKPFRDQITEKAFVLFAKEGWNNNVEVRFTSPTKIKQGVVSEYWVYNNKWIYFSKEFNPKVVYSYLAYNDKNKKVLGGIDNEKTIKLINPLQFVQLCFDKWKFVKFLSNKLHPQTFLVNNKSELKQALKKIKTEKIVLKPRFGLRGKDVWIGKKVDIRYKVGKNTLVQEFVKSKKSFLGQTGESFDLRLLMINDKLDHAYIRVASKGSLASNCALGAKKIIVNLRNIPDEVLTIAKQVDKKLVQFLPRIYSIDFMLGADGRFYVIELESMPGFFHYAGAQAKFRKQYFKNIFKLLD
jgi:glutathione synthase/RimK-type ligase-like ATP-grasp enzyme